LESAAAPSLAEEESAPTGTNWITDYEENVKDLEALVDGNELREVVLALVTIALGGASPHELAGP
jgi:hypothetical protein